MMKMIGAICLMSISLTALAEQTAPVVCRSSESIYSAHGAPQSPKLSTALVAPKTDGGSQLQGHFTDSPQIQFYVFVRDNNAEITLNSGSSNEAFFRASGQISKSQAVSATMSGALINGQANVSTLSCQLAD